MSRSAREDLDAMDYDGIVDYNLGEAVGGSGAAARRWGSAAARRRSSTTTRCNATPSAWPYPSPGATAPRCRAAARACRWRDVRAHLP